MPASSHVTFTLLSDAALIASYSQLGVKTGAASSWSYFNKTLSSPVSAMPNEDGEVDIYIIAGVDNFQPAFLLKFQGWLGLSIGNMTSIMVHYYDQVKNDAASLFIIQTF